MDTKNLGEEKQKLLNISYSENYSRRVRIRAMTLNMHLNMVSETIIAKTLCICDKTVKNYIRNYVKNGLLGLLQENPYRPKSELENYTDKIVESLEAEPCATINECCERIEKITGIKRSPTQVANFVKKRNLSISKQVKSLQKQTPQSKKSS
jgi:transposase